jgi:hypothetical protein
VSGRTKPRRIHRRATTTNPIALAVLQASKAEPEDIDLVIKPLQVAFTALREGVATELQWCVLASNVGIAMTIEQQGIVRGLGAHLVAADRALHAIYRRAMEHGAWRPTALYWQEIDAIDEFIPLHRFQLEQLSRGELARAVEKTRAAVAGGRGRVIDVRTLGRQEQLQLLGAAL